MFRRLFLVLVAVVLLLSDKGQIAGDGIVRWNALVALVEDHHLNPEKYSLAQPVLATPLYAIGAVAASGASPAERREHRILAARKLVGRFNKVVAFLIALAFFRLARVIFGFSEIQVAVSTLGLLFGSILIPNARDFYSECLWTLLSLVALYLLSISDSSSRLSRGIAIVLVLALAVPLNPMLFLVCGALLGGLLLGAARRRQLHFTALYGAAGLFLGAAIALAENYLRRGSVFRTGYEGEGFTTPLWVGLWGQIAAPARGILWFMPAFLIGPLLLALYRDRLPGGARRFIQLSLLYSCGLVLAYATWWSWHGSWYWGPRFLLPLSVFGVSYLALLVKYGGSSRVIKTVAVVVGVASFLIYKIGVSVNQRHLLDCLRSARDENSCYWSWAYSPPASLLSFPDLHDMLTHRSTLVEMVTIILFLTLWRFVSRASQREP